MRDFDQDQRWQRDINDDQIQHIPRLFGEDGETFDPDADQEEGQDDEEVLHINPENVRSLTEK